MVSGYTPLPQDATIQFEKNGYTRSNVQPSAPARWKGVMTALGALLAVSLTANAITLYQRFVRPWDLTNDLPSRYAHLRRNVPTEILSSSDYDSLNRTVQDSAWNAKEMEPWNGFLALDEDYALGQDLPHSQRWPWDLSRGVYILTASHELHCTRVLRVYVNENYDGVPEAEQTWHYPHIMHCLNVLRESVVCNADDTPLYIGRLHKNIDSDHPRAGIGTMKMCRDWNAMLEWSYARSACYRPAVDNEVDRYKYCPDGSRPWEHLKGDPI